jgi:hypothetical protein
MEQGVTNIFVNELPGSDKVLFHIVGTRNSDVLTKTEAVSRGVNEIRRGSRISGPANILTEIKTRGQMAILFDQQRSIGAVIC